MKLGVQVGLGFGHTVLYGDPVFGPCSLWPNGWMKMPLGTKVGLDPARHIVLSDRCPLGWLTGGFHICPPSSLGRQLSAHYCSVVDAV